MHKDYYTAPCWVPRHIIQKYAMTEDKRHYFNCELFSIVIILPHSFEYMK